MVYHSWTPVLTPEIGVSGDAPTAPQGGMLHNVLVSTAAGIAYYVMRPTMAYIHCLQDQYKKEIIKRIQLNNWGWIETSPGCYLETPRRQMHPQPFNSSQVELSYRNSERPRNSLQFAKLTAPTDRASVGITVGAIALGITLLLTVVLAYTVYEHYQHVYATRALVRRVEHTDATRAEDYQALEEKVRLATSLLSVYRQSTHEQRPPNPTPPHLEVEDDTGEDANLSQTYYPDPAYTRPEGSRTMYVLQSQQPVEHPPTHPPQPSLPSTSQHVVAQPQPAYQPLQHHPQSSSLVHAVSQVTQQQPQPQQPQLQQQPQQAPAAHTAGPLQQRRLEPHQLYIRNLHFYIRCLDSTPDPRGHYEMYNIPLSQPLSVAYLSSLIHDDDPPLRKVCYAHHVTRTHLSPGRALHAKTHNLLYRGPDDLIVTVYSMPPHATGESLVPLSATRHILDKYCADLQNIERPFLSYWLLYKGYHPAVNDEFQRILLDDGRNQYLQNPNSVHDLLHSYCNELHFPDTQIDNPERLDQIIGQL